MTSIWKSQAHLTDFTWLKLHKQGHFRTGNNAFEGKAAHQQEDQLFARSLSSQLPSVL